MSTCGDKRVLDGFNADGALQIVDAERHAWACHVIFTGKAMLMSSAFRKDKRVGVHNLSAIHAQNNRTLS